jgi:hypothetical protein
MQQRLDAAPQSAALPTRCVSGVPDGRPVTCALSTGVFGTWRAFGIAAAGESGHGALKRGDGGSANYQSLGDWNGAGIRSVWSYEQLLTTLLRQICHQLARAHNF